MLIIFKNKNFNYRITIGVNNKSFFLMSNYAAVKLPVNDISSLSKKDKKQTSPNKLNIPNVYEDLDDPSDNNSNDS